MAVGALSSSSLNQKCVQYLTIKYEACYRFLWTYFVRLWNFSSSPRSSTTGMVVKFVFNCFSVLLNTFIKLFSFSVSIVNYSNRFCNVEPFLDDWCTHHHTHTHVHHSVFGFSTKFLRYSLNLLGYFSIFYYVLGNLHNAPKKLLLFLACFLFN